MTTEEKTAHDYFRSFLTSECSIRIYKKLREKGHHRCFFFSILLYCMMYLFKSASGYIKISRTHIRGDYQWRSFGSKIVQKRSYEMGWNCKIIRCNTCYIIFVAIATLMDFSNECGNLCSENQIVNKVTAEHDVDEELGWIKIGECT